MAVYHMSQTLKLGDILEADRDHKAVVCQAFIQALERSEDCFYGMVLNGKYLYAVLEKSGLWEWADYAKWATEGAFEFVRKTEYPHSYSRLKSNYFYDDLTNCKKLFAYDWGNEPEEDQQLVHLYEIEVEDSDLQKRDMRLYDKAYEVMSESQDVQVVLDCARKYFSGEHSETPIWEILSEKPAKAIKDITSVLHE